MKKSEVEALEKKKYPIGVEHYTLYEEVGVGGMASVHRALCVPYNEIVAIKILDLERERCDLNNVCREAQTMVLVDNPNVVKSHCSFVKDHTLWVVMPFMAAGSCLHILKAAHPTGFEEAVIATVLREVLKGLDYLHSHGFVHRDVKAGNILIDSRGRIQLGDLGVSACLFDCGDRQRSRNTIVGTPCWMAPEVMEQLNGYDFKADIWSFGITALELAHGHAPFSRYPPVKVLLMTLQNAPPGLDYESDKKFSRSFRQMISTCLVKDPKKRPTAKKLLKHSFFKKARSSEYIYKTLLEGLPAGLGDRVQMLKRKEEDMVAQKKMPDGEKEEISQKEYNRGISDWNFDLEVVKAQVALIQDDEIIAETSCSATEVEKYQRQMSSASQYSEHSDVDESLDHVLSETCSNAAKSSVSGDELEEKTKCPVVQKKGRFKVTSENVDFEKVSPTVSVLHKPSIVGATTSAPPNDLSITGAIASAPPNQVYQMLQGILQNNIHQRESILLLMKQLSCGGETSAVSTNLMEKSLLEAAHDREKELIREVTDLQTRLMYVQEELQKVKNLYTQPDI